MASERYAELIADIGIAPHSRLAAVEVLLQQLEHLPRGRALDAPCGPGLLSEALRRLGFEVTAADVDEAGFVPRDIPFQRVDLDAPLPFDDAAFDLVVCGDGIEHLENPFALFRELARVLDAKGTLVVATPNYLNLERRLNFLWSGSLTKPLSRAPEAHAAARDKSARGHINPLTLIRMAHTAESVGLTLERTVTCLPKPRQYWLAPIALAIRALVPFLGERYRRDLYAEHTLTLGALLGGKKLIATFRKAA